MVPRIFLCLVALVSVSGTSACRQQACAACIASVFQGFSFVGDYPDTTKSQEIRPGRPRAFPSQFQAGRIYIFQPTGRVDAAQVAIQTLPNRLRKCSATILYAPTSPDDFAVASLGGPFWGIRFRMNRCSGEITNRYDRELDAARIGWPSGSRDDYVLRLSKEP